jgi:hypothetical protein
MPLRQWKIRMAVLGMLVVLAGSLTPRAYASSATLLLEEPYGKLGFFTATGHAAVYMSDVCADTPVHLRRCKPGETGVVLSRYDGVGGYDWIAIPLVPYLYAVEKPQDIPLFADPKMVGFLRDRYRRAHLEDIAPDTADSGTPNGNWYELVGTSYDRTVYGYEIETTPARDAALIRKLNASPNRSHFHTVSHNCADFAKDIINFYYPRTLHRSIVADVGMTTPKQMAKMLDKFGNRHSELQFSRLVISQVPGSVPRSTAVHGVVESFFKSKKYIVPSAFASPIFAGCIFAVYVGSVAGRFDPGHDALVYNASSEPELPLRRDDRLAYQKELESLLARDTEGTDMRVEKSWGRLQAKAKADVDEHGMPVLQMQLGEEKVSLGIAAENILKSDAPPQLIQQLLEARLQSELQRWATSRVSVSEVARDWRLLQQARSADSKDSADAVAPSAPEISAQNESAAGSRR